MKPILEVKNLRKVYKEFLLDNISFSLPKGYIMGVIGPNGAGKSTTIQLIMNILHADGGVINIFGLDYDCGEEEIKHRIGYVGEEQNFYEDRTVAWTEKFIAQYYKNWDHKLFQERIKQFKVSPKKKIKDLSKGMKVKLAIALALAHHPDLLILDEPTSGLDPVIRSEILDILLDFIQDENKSVLFSSHITEDIEKIADYVTYIVDGKIILSDEKENILAHWKKIHLKKEWVTKDIRTHLEGIEENYFGISGITKDYSSLAPHFKTPSIKAGVKVSPVTLDDVLISMVKGEKK